MNSARTDRPGRLARAGSVLLNLAREHGSSLALCLAVLVTVSLLSAVIPEPADAKGGWLDGLPDPGDIGDEVKEGAVGAFGSILEALFGGIQAELTQELIEWLISIPNFAKGNVAELAQTTNAIAFGLMGVVMTYSVIRYWLTGLSMSGSGGMEAIEGFTRTIGAALFIVAWPFLFHELIALANLTSEAVIQSAGVKDDLAKLFRVAVVAQFTTGAISGGLGWIISILIALVSTLLLLALMMMKIVLTAAVTFLFVGMPIAVILWPISELSWVAKYAMKTLLTCCLIPLCWAILFALWAAVTMDALTFKGGDSLLDKAIVGPLVSMAMLFIAVTLPKTLMRAATMGAKTPGGGFVSRTASYVAGSTAGGAVRSQIPQQFGGSKPGMPKPEMNLQTPFKGPNGERGSIGMKIDPSNAKHVAEAAKHAPGMAAAAQAINQASAMSKAGSQMAKDVAGTPTQLSAGGGAGAGAGAAAGAAGARSATEAAQTADPPIKPSFNQARFEEERDLAAARRADPATMPTARQTADAMRNLPPNQQRRVMDAIKDPKANADVAIAREATAPWNSGYQQQNLRTLAAASNDIRKQAMSINEAGFAEARPQPASPMESEVKPQAAAAPAGSSSSNVGGSSPASASPAPASTGGSVPSNGGSSFRSGSTPQVPHTPGTTSANESPATPAHGGNPNSPIQKRGGQ